MVNRLMKTAAVVHSAVLYGNWSHSTSSEGPNQHHQQRA
jgi:hypothetical protein